jgi:hypothetical protein
LKRLIHEHYIRQNSSFRLPSSSSSFNHDHEIHDASSIATDPSTENLLIDALVNLFINYEFANLPEIPPQELRMSLSTISDKFQIGDIADANEAMEMILYKLHSEIQPRCPGNHTCLSHTVFTGVLVEQSICLVCGATSEPAMKSNFLHTIYAKELIGLAKERKYSFKEFESHYGNNAGIEEYGWLLRRCLESTQQRCPSIPDPTPPSASPPSLQLDLDTAIEPELHGEVDDSPGGAKEKEKDERPPCSQKAHVKCYCLEPPLCLALSIVWSTDHESPDTVRSFIDIIATRIVLSDLFVGHSSLPFESLPYTDRKSPQSSSISSIVSARALSPTYAFRGLVCYYGLHYVSIFQEYLPSGKGRFLLFDDKNIRVIGSWDDVREECVRSHYQPVLLLYELEHEHADDHYHQHSRTQSQSMSWFSSFFRSNQPKHVPSKLHVVEDVIRRKSSRVSDQKSSSPASSSPILRHFKELRRKEVILSFKDQFIENHLRLNQQESMSEIKFHMGMILEEDSSGHVRIVSFTRHPDDDSILPAEKSGQIDLMDRLIAIQGFDVTKMSTAEVLKLLKSYRHLPMKSYLKMLLNNEVVSENQRHYPSIVLSLESAYEWDYR